MDRGAVANVTKEPSMASTAQYDASENTVARQVATSVPTGERHSAEFAELLERLPAARSFPLSAS
jgi:hypothetical protein